MCPVAGSNPAGGALVFLSIAQRIEQHGPNVKVGGSNPPGQAKDLLLLWLKTETDLAVSTKTSTPKTATGLGLRSMI